MRTRALSKYDISVCRRLKDAREYLGVTQAQCAAQIGVERSTFANYERARAPLRCDVALRFCRQFVISEEWLATGRHDACHASAKAHGQGWNREMDDLIFRRQCMDLGGEPGAESISPNALFRGAWTETLAPLYSNLVLHWFYLPRVSLHDEDNMEIGINILNAVHQRHLIILRNESLRLKKSEGLVLRTYVRCMFESADLVLKKFLGAKLPAAALEQLHWLRYAATDPNAVIGPLLVSPEPQRIESIPMPKTALTKH